MKNIIRGIILICIILLLLQPRGYGDLGVMIMLYFLLEYFYFLKRKSQAIVDDSGNKYYFAKIILSTVISPATLLLSFFLVGYVSPDYSNVKPATGLIFVIILLFTILYVDIKRREGNLRRSTFNGCIYGALISVAIFSFIIFNS